MSSVNGAVRKVLASGLATRFDVSLRVAKKFIPEVIEQWGKLRRLEGGDIMHAHKIVSRRRDGRDASFVRVCDLFFFWKILDFYLLPNK